jgi:serpin B
MSLAENYGAGLRLVDYASAAEAARQQINAWVEDETQDKIKDLIPAGARIH